MEFFTLVWLLPIIFMIHDFEEIIMMQAWFKKNKEYLLSKFPRLGRRIVHSYENLSTASFSLAVLEEFIILSLASCLASVYDFYWLWTACFLAFFIHLFMHIAQWLIIRKYIPAVFTSFLSLPYCIYTFKTLINNELFGAWELVFTFIAGIVLLALNLVLIHKLAACFERWLIKYSGN